MNLSDFLSKVITTKKGWFCLAYRPANTPEWINLWYEWPVQLDEILAQAEKLFNDNNVYFSTHLFSDKVKSRLNVLPSRTIAADLDEANLGDVPLEPTLITETSPGKHQAYWIFNEDTDTDTLETLSRKITYSIPNADHGCWQLGHMLRVPGSFNYKYFDGPKAISITGFSGKTYNTPEVELLPDHSKASATLELDWINSDIAIPDKKPLELLENIKVKLGAKIYNQYSIEQKDRSAALWALTCGAFRAGCTREQVFGLAWYSANNKFANLKYHAKRELAKDVLRAEALVNSKIPDIRSAITAMRKLKGFKPERNQQLFSVIKDLMIHEGEFFHADDETLWYIRRDSGRPIAINSRSVYLDSLLDLEYGLNASEQEHNFVIDSMQAFTRALDTNAQMACMSRYKPTNNIVLLHSGRKDVYLISPTEIKQTTNGSYNTLFPWNSLNDPCAISFDPLEKPWYKTIFGLEPYNVTSISEELFYVLHRVWFIFLIMRDAASSRPLLSYIGQPGSAKSSVFKRIYRLIYGTRRSLDNVNTPDDYDQAVSTDPFVCLDNVDTWERWLPDRLALSISTSDRQKRELYTNKDTVILKRQAMIGISAHNPKFGREDVADRMLISTFERLPYWIPESQMLDHITNVRGKLWGAIIQDIQTVLRTAEPEYNDIPQFRIEDFARLGYRIAQGLGIANEFKQAIAIIRDRQKGFTLEEDTFLVTTISNFVKRQNGTEQWLTASRLFDELQTSSGDSRAFQRQYGNPIRLGKKLLAMQDSLREIFNIDKQLDPSKGVNTWRIKDKN